MKHKKKKNTHPDYIDWPEFNRLLKKKEGVPFPTRDSRDDSAKDALEETVMGKNYPEEPLARTKDLPLAESPKAQPDNIAAEEEIDERVGVRSSTRPDPILDIDAPSSTH